MNSAYCSFLNKMCLRIICFCLLVSSCDAAQVQKERRVPSVHASGVLRFYSGLRQTLSCSTHKLWRSRKEIPVRCCALLQNHIWTNLNQVKECLWSAHLVCLIVLWIQLK